VGLDAPSQPLPPVQLPARAASDAGVALQQQLRASLASPLPPTAADAAAAHHHPAGPPATAPPARPAALYLRVDVVEARGLPDRASDGVGPAAFVKASVHHVWRRQQQQQQQRPGGGAGGAGGAGIAAAATTNATTNNYNSSRKTRTVYRNRHPMWDQSLVIPLDPPTAAAVAAAATAVAAARGTAASAAPSPPSAAGGPSVLLVEAYHRIDLTRKALLGRLVLSLEDVALHAAADEAGAAGVAAGGWYRLCGPSLPLASLASARRDSSLDDAGQEGHSPQQHGAVRLRLRLLGAGEAAAAERAAQQRQDSEALAAALSRRQLRVRLGGLAGLAASGVLREVVALGLASAAANVTAGGSAAAQAAVAAAAAAAATSSSLMASSSTTIHDPPPPLSLQVRLGRVWVERPLPLTALVALAARVGILPREGDGGARREAAAAEAAEEAAPDMLALDEEVVVPLSGRALRVLRRRDELVDVRVYLKSGETTVAKAQVPLAALLAKTAGAGAQQQPAAASALLLARRSSPVVFDLTADARMGSGGEGQVAANNTFAGSVEEMMVQTTLRKEAEQAAAAGSAAGSRPPSVAGAGGGEEQAAAVPAHEVKLEQQQPSSSMLARAIRSSRRRLSSFSFSSRAPLLTPVASVEAPALEAATAAAKSSGGGNHIPAHCSDLLRFPAGGAGNNADPSACGEEACDAVSSLTGGVAAAPAPRPRPPPLGLVGGRADSSSPPPSPLSNRFALLQRRPPALTCPPDNVGSSHASTPTTAGSPGVLLRPPPDHEGGGGGGGAGAMALSLLRRSLSSVPGSERVAAAAAAAVAAVRNSTTGGGGGGCGQHHHHHPPASTTPSSPQGAATAVSASLLLPTPSVRRVATFACVRSLERSSAISVDEEQQQEEVGAGAAAGGWEDGDSSPCRPRLARSSLPALRRASMEEDALPAAALARAPSPEAPAPSPSSPPPSPRSSPSPRSLGSRRNNQQQQHEPERPDSAPPRRLHSSGLLSLQPSAGAGAYPLARASAHHPSSGLTSALRSGGSFSSGRWAELDRAVRTALRPGEGPVQAEWVAVGGLSRSASMRQTAGGDNGPADALAPADATATPPAELSSPTLICRVMDSQIPLETDLEISLFLSIEPGAAAVDALDATTLGTASLFPPAAASSRRLGSLSAGRGLSSSRSPSPVLAALRGASVGLASSGGVGVGAAAEALLPPLPPLALSSSSLPTTPTADLLAAAAGGGTSTDDELGSPLPRHASSSAVLRGGRSGAASSLLLLPTPPLPLPAPLPVPVVSDAHLPLTPARVYALVFGRRSSAFMARLHAAEGLTDVRIGPWERVPVVASGVRGVAPTTTTTTTTTSGLAGRRRVVTYTRPLNIPLPFAPKSCRITEEHIVLAASGRGAGGGFVAELRATSDAPRGDCFSVRVQLAAVPALGCPAASPASASHVRATLSVDFFKAVLGRGVIEASAAGDSRRVYGALLQGLRDEAAAMAAGGGSGGGGALSSSGGAAMAAMAARRCSSNGGGAAASATVGPFGSLGGGGADGKPPLDASAQQAAAGSAASPRLGARLHAWLAVGGPSSSSLAVASMLVRLLSACLIAWALLCVAGELCAVAEALRVLAAAATNGDGGAGPASQCAGSLAAAAAAASMSSSTSPLATLAAATVTATTALGGGGRVG
jgi:hypothetical protein